MKQALLFDHRAMFAAFALGVCLILIGACAVAGGASSPQPVGAGDASDETPTVADPFLR